MTKAKPAEQCTCGWRTIGRFELPECKVHPLDYQTRWFWEEVLKHGPMGLTRHDWATVESKLDEAGRRVLRRLLQQVEEQAKWCVEREAELRGEQAHITKIGQTLALAGLRSYTDKEGRIFVASQRHGEDK